MMVVCIFYVQLVLELLLAPDVTQASQDVIPPHPRLPTSQSTAKSENKMDKIKLENQTQNGVCTNTDIDKIAIRDL